MPIDDWYGITVNDDGRVIYLSLLKNGISGPIPSELAGLDSLRWLWLSWNQLTGSIPTELDKLTNLERLHLNGNQLTGSIPAELGNLASLTQLLLYDNQLTGQIPTELGKLTNLTWLELSINRLSGSIPTQFGNLTNLEYLYLDRNQLTGSIPTQLGNLINLKYLYLNQNQLTGSIPTQLGNLTNLEKLYLHNNRLTGSIPTQLGNLTKLEKLWLNQNRLTGSIPTQLGNLNKLEQLWLQYNRLTGSIPTQLGNLTKLEHLLLHNNRLTGSIPAELENLINLTWLHLNHNTELTGELPLGLMNLPIRSLDIRCTRITTPANADFQTWLSGIDLFWEGSEGCATTTPPTTTPTTPPTTPPKPPMYDGPRYVRPGFDKSTRDTLILTLTWEPPEFNQDEVTGYKYKIYEGPPQTRVFPALIDWTRIGNVQQQDIHVQSDAFAYTVLLSAVMADTTTQYAQVGAYVPNGIMSAILHAESELPADVSLGQNYPNPFNPSTTIAYRLDRPGAARLSVYDLTGRTVSVLVDGVQPAGRHEVRFDAEDLPTGTYLYRLQTPSETQTRTMILVR